MKADEVGVKPGVTEQESVELREARRRIRLFEQEAEVMRRAVAYLSRDVNPKCCTRWSVNWPLTVSPSR
jgi:transposase